MTPPDPAKCKTCGGVGLIGGLQRFGDGEVDSIVEPCPDCATPDPAAREAAIEFAAQRLRTRVAISDDWSVAVMHSIFSEMENEGYFVIVHDEGHEDGKTLAVNFCVNQLSSMLGNPEWTAADGSETWEGDVGGTLYNILVAAGVIDPETNAVATHDAAEKRAEEMAARVKVLEAALKPFAEAFDGDDDFPKDEWELWGRPETMNLTVRDLRKACQAYNGSAALAQETPHE